LNQILYLGGEDIHDYLGVGGFRTIPLARLIFIIFEKLFSEEIDNLSLLDFFQIHNLSKKVVPASSSKWS
jgi:hypothetical protein